MNQNYDHLVMNASEVTFSSELTNALAKELGSGLVSERRADKFTCARDLWQLDTIRVREGIVSPTPDAILNPGKMGC